MLVQLSDEIQREVEATIRSKAGGALILDVYATAEDIRRRHPAQDVVLEDIAASLASLATQCGRAVEFGGRAHVVMNSQSD